MSILRLPDSSAFSTTTLQKEWMSTLSAQQQADVQALFTLKQEVISLDQSSLAPKNKLERVEVLRTAIAPFLQRLAPLFSRKRLPQSNTEHAIFVLNTRTLKHLALVYLRTLKPFLRQSDSASLSLALHRSAVILRHWQWCAYLSARMPAKESVEWLIYILNLSHKQKLLSCEQADPAAVKLGKTSIGGQIAWALIIIAARPLRLNLAQSKVAQRVAARWRETAHFYDQKQNENAVSFSEFYAQHPAPDELCWIDFSTLLKKIDQRIAALNRGQTPAQVKLGNDLTLPECRQLLLILKTRFQKNIPLPQLPAQDIRAQPCALHFNAFDAYPRLIQNLKDWAIPETWVQFNHFVWRTPHSAIARHASPSLIVQQNPLRLGLLNALCEDAFGGLFSTIELIEEHLEFGQLVGQDGAHVPFFFIVQDTQNAVLVPADSPLNLHQTYATLNCSQKQFTPFELFSRGSNFLHYWVQ